MTKQEEIFGKLISLLPSQLDELIFYLEADFPQLKTKLPLVSATYAQVIETLIKELSECPDGFTKLKEKLHIVAPYMKICSE